MQQLPGTAFYRKWSRMPWWSRLHHLKQSGHLRADSELWRDLGALVEPVDRQWKVEGARMMSDARKELTGEEPRPNAEAQERQFFLDRLFALYPELRNAAVPVSAEAAEVGAARYSNAQTLKLVEGLYLGYARRAKSEGRERAAREVLERFEDRIALKLAEISRTEDVAASLRAVPLLDALRAHSARESHLKTKRVERDQQLVTELAGGLEQAEELETHCRVAPPARSAAEAPAEGEGRAFVARNWRLFWKYWDDQLARDKLGAFAQPELLVALRELPSSLKRHYAPLLKQLDRLGVRLAADGAVDFSAAERADPNRAAKLRRREAQVKAALMWRDLRFGFDHQLSAREAAEALRQKALALNAQTGAFFREVNRQKVQEMLERLRLRQSEVDAAVDFRYYRADAELAVDARARFSDEDLSAEAFLEGRAQRIDFQSALLESPHERNLRLERVWLASQIRAAAPDRPLAERALERYVEVAAQLRRLKLAMDARHFRASGERFFAEHAGLDLALADPGLAALEDYLRVPRRSFLKSPEHENEYQKTRAIIAQPVLRKDYADPLAPPQPLGEEDARHRAWTRLRAPPAPEDAAPAEIDDEELFFFNAYAVKLTEENLSPLERLGREKAVAEGRRKLKPRERKEKNRAKHRAEAKEGAAPKKK